MGVIEEFNEILVTYDDRLHAIFKREIDKAIADCKKENLDDLETFIYVNSKIDELFNQLSVSWGLIEPNQTYNESHLPITAELMAKIYDHTNDLSIKATNQILLMSLELLESKTLDELRRRYEKLDKICKRLDEQHISFIYEGIELKKVK